MNPYRTGPQPALWLPGVICVQSDGQIHAGPLAGWRAPRGINRWKRNVVIVEKGALDGDWPPAGPFTRPLHLRLPEERISARFSRVLQAALACPVVALTTSRKADLMAAGLPFLFVGWHCVSRSGYFSSEGSGHPARGVGGELERLPILSTNEQPPTPPTIDQILRGLSNGAVAEEAVELATDLLDVIDSKESLAHWEAWLEALFARAQPLEAEARGLARAIAAPRSGPLPFYDGIRRARRPAMVIRCSDSPDELALPAVDELIVSGIEEYRPDSHLG